ncbi:MAG: mannose-1-phosphate guanylyltransferase [Patescibacteria group bacterium]|jgi:mannose-1-phosphate guanylyltransferase
MAINIVLLAGGSGTRLWPMSRTNLPKQLQKLVGDKTLIQQTYERVENITEKENIFVSTGTKYVPEIEKQVPQIPRENVIAEPKAMNTAAAIGLAAIHLYHRDKQSIMVSLHSDHIVTEVGNFHKAIHIACETIKHHPEYIMTVGINPITPSTELGYIQMDGAFEVIDEEQVYKVKRFVEKPDAATAVKFLSSFQYLWNAGYFVWRVDTLLDLFKELLPNTYKHLMAIEKAIGTPEYHKVLAEHYDLVDAVAIDVAILEKCNKIAVIPADLGWSDVGTWSSLHDILTTITGHHLISKGHHAGYDTENCLVYAGEKMIATVGLRNVIVVDTPDVLLIADKSKAHDVKKLLDKLKDEGKHLYL